VRNRVPDAARELGAGQEAQLGKSRSAHLLGFVDQEHRPIQRVFDVMKPLFAQNFSAGPSVVRSQGDRGQVAEFAIQIGHCSL